VAAGSSHEDAAHLCILTLQMRILPEFCGWAGARLCRPGIGRQGAECCGCDCSQRHRRL